MLVVTGKLEAYYWDVYALIFENDDILALGSPDFRISGPLPAKGMKDRAWPIDIGFVCFETVLQRIRERFF
ncbi:MAG: hypothetical protein ACE5GO_08685 [Anaerolineales bacterium]